MTDDCIAQEAGTSIRRNSTSSGRYRRRRRRRNHHFQAATLQILVVSLIVAAVRRTTATCAAARIGSYSTSSTATLDLSYGDRQKRLFGSDAAIPFLKADIRTFGKESALQIRGGAGEEDSNDESADFDSTHSAKSSVFSLDDDERAEGDDASSNTVTASNPDGDDEAEDEEEEDSDDDEVEGSVADEEDDESDDEEEVESGDEREEESDEDDEEEEEASSSLSPPITVTVKTALGNGRLDQSVELLNVQPGTRTVGSIKQSLQRQLIGRPPLSALQHLVHDNLLLTDDDMLIEELLDDEDADDDYDDEEESSKGGLVLYLDMIPPVDPKTFTTTTSSAGSGITSAAAFDDMTVSELLAAYALNEAARHRNSALILQEQEQKDDEDDDDDDEDDEPVAETPLQLCRSIQQHAEQLKGAMEATLMSSSEAQELLQETRAPSVIAAELASSSSKQQLQQVRGHRVRTGAGVTPGGSATPVGLSSHWRRSIQKQLNLHWGDTLRTICLFLFFGHFGGRTPMSRAILLLGAPAVLVLQARPVKLALKQVLYTLLMDPPSILLSLLPAPQQTVLSTDVDADMQRIYGEYAVETQHLVAAAAAAAKVETNRIRTKRPQSEADFEEETDDEDDFESEGEDEVDAEDDYDDEDEDESDDDDF